MGSFAFGTETEYKAQFTSASLLQKGDDVRVAGVTVGSVKEVEIRDRDAAEITFKIKEDVPLTTRRAPRSGSSTWSATATWRSSRVSQVPSG